MKKANQLMAVLAIALTVVLVTASLHHLKKKVTSTTERDFAKPVNATGLTFHIGLLPDVSINVFVNNQ